MQRIGDSYEFSKDKEKGMQKIEHKKRKKSMALTNVFVIPRMNDIWNHAIHFCISVCTLQSAFSFS